jgi:hypothetical protein
VADICNQGRGRISEISQALEVGDILLFEQEIATSENELIRLFTDRSSAITCSADLLNSDTYMRPLKFCLDYL